MTYLFYLVGDDSNNEKNNWENWKALHLLSILSTVSLLVSDKEALEQSSYICISVLKEVKGDRVPLVSTIERSPWEARSFMACPGLKHQ